VNDMHDRKKKRGSRSSPLFLPKKGHAPKQKSQPFEKATLWRLFIDEILGDNKQKELIPLEKLTQVYNFAMVLFHFEKALFFGFWVCLDAFLYMFSVLPLRLLLFIAQLFLSFMTFSNHISKRQWYEFIQAAIFIITSAILITFCDSSHVYHWIRQQQAIRLYMLFSILEIFDKLASSFGQDIFDALYSNLRFYRIRKRDRAFLFLHVGFSELYVLVHSIVLFCQLISLNVAINSTNYTLLHLLISNNFAELKSTVFKRFRADNIFQLTCLDIVERFQIIIFLSLVVLHNIYDMSWHIPTPWLISTIQSFAVIITAELTVDWLKHCFVTKFNNVSYKCYPKYLAFLRYDALCSSSYCNPRHFAQNQKFISQTKRIGFVPLPLACLAVRMVYPMIPALTISEGVFLIFGIIFLVSLLKTIIKKILLNHCMRRLPIVLREIKTEPGESTDLSIAMRYEFTKLGSRIP